MKFVSSTWPFTELRTPHLETLSPDANAAAVQQVRDLGRGRGEGGILRLSLRSDLLTRQKLLPGAVLKRFRGCNPDRMNDCSTLLAMPVRDERV